MNKKAFATIAGLGFIVILAIVFILNIIIPDKGFSENENRILQEKPSFSLSSYFEGRYEEKLDNYVDDQFLLRNFFIKTKASADTTEGKVESNGVYNCKDDYLMEEIKPINQENMENTLSALKLFKRKYSNKKMYFLLAPNAANILSDKLPMAVRLNDQNKEMDKFFSSVTDIGIRTIDVRNVLKKHAEDTQIYYRTDHHWTTNGAYLSFKQAVSVMKLKDTVNYEPYVVKKDFRGTLASKSGFTNGIDDAITIYMPKNKEYKNSVIYYADTKEKTTEFYKLDNLKTKDAYTVFGGSNHPIYTIKTPSDSRGTLLVIKDSYANSFIPFIAQCYKKVVVVDPRYFYDDIDDIIKSEGVTEVLFLYNANTFFGDNSLEMMLSN